MGDNGVRADAVRLEQVRELTLAGVIARDIAARLGISERTVQRHRVRLGIADYSSKRVYTPDEWALAVRLLDEGASYSEVGRTLGCSYHAVQRRFPGKGWQATTLTGQLRVLEAAGGVGAGSENK